MFLFMYLPVYHKNYACRGGQIFFVTFYMIFFGELAIPIIN